MSIHATRLAVPNFYKQRYIVENRCSNAQRGTFGHECGRRATWLATDTDKMPQAFCDNCKVYGDERHGFSKWEAFRECFYQYNMIDGVNRAREVS